ncbi:unnamed protein product [Durusdinium trenchii]|uniref:Uncharacterized protein n=1 Tax=Durusdinium trenchii TaxID=1381693 RepID=A0ABP0PFI3_9DINO
MQPICYSTHGWIWDSSTAPLKPPSIQITRFRFSDCSCVMSKPKSEATAVVYARCFVEAINKLPPYQISDLPLDVNQVDVNPTTSASIASLLLEQRHQDRVQPELD